MFENLQLRDKVKSARSYVFSRYGASEACGFVLGNAPVPVAAEVASAVSDDNSFAVAVAAGLAGTMGYIVGKLFSYTYFYRQEYEDGVRQRGKDVKALTRSFVEACCAKYSVQPTLTYILHEAGFSPWFSALAGEAVGSAAGFCVNTAQNYRRGILEPATSPADATLEEVVSSSSD